MSFKVNWSLLKKNVGFLYKHLSRSAVKICQVIFFVFPFCSRCDVSKRLKTYLCCRMKSDISGDGFFVFMTDFLNIPYLFQKVLPISTKNVIAFEFAGEIVNSSYRVH